MKPDKSDKKLIKSVAHGDKQAFEELYRRYNVKIYNYLDRLVFDKEYVNDLFQNVFIKVFQKAHLYKPKYNFSTWIYKIASNEFIDYYKKVKKTNKNIVFNDEYITNAKEVKIEDVIYNEEKLKYFYKAMDELEPKYREAFVLYRIQGLTAEETGKILDVSPRTVVTYNGKAESFIKTYLSQNGFT